MGERGVHLDPVGGEDASDIHDHVNPAPHRHTLLGVG